MGFWLLKYILSYGIRLNFCFTLPTGTLFTKQKPEVRLSDYLKMANRLWLWALIIIALVVCQLINPPRSLFTSYDWSLSEPARVWVSFWFIMAFSFTYITVTVCHCDSGVISSCALACERALLFGRAKQASRERRSLARSRALARLASLAQIGELASRLPALLATIICSSKQWIKLKISLLFPYRSSAVQR